MAREAGLTARSDDNDALVALLVAGGRRGTLANRLLMQLAMVASSPQVLKTVLDETATQGTGPGAEAAREVRQLWQSLPEAWTMVHSALAVLRETADAGMEGIGRWTTVFDRLAGVSPAVGAALYSFGRSDLLDAATGEVVSWMVRADLPLAGGRCLDLGCGMGRFCRALAPVVTLMVGLDVSEVMLRAARRHCSEAGNVTFLRSAGHDLACLGSGVFDLVYAIDSFPYLVDLGSFAVDTHFREAFRVLRPGGVLFILNYSYRGDDGTDRHDVEICAQTTGFDIIVSGGDGPDQWDGCVFLLRKGGEDLVRPDVNGTNGALL